MSNQTTNNISDARLNANRQNAQLSTGPTTDRGRSVSSKNAVRHALTGRTVLLPTDDADRYEQHCLSFKSEWNPETQRETILTQSVADAWWRLERIASFEMAIFAQGRAQLNGAYADEPESIRNAIIELEISRMHDRELRNLHLQESRIRRQRDRDIEELRYLQAERKRLQEEKIELACHMYRKAKSEERTFDPAEFGFVFSIEEIERYWNMRKARMGYDAAKSFASKSPVRGPKAA